MKLRFLGILILSSFPNIVWGSGSWLQNPEFGLGIRGNIFDPDISRFDSRTGVSAEFSIPMRKDQLSLQAVVFKGISKNGKNLLIDYGVWVVDYPYLYLYNLPLNAREEESHQLSGLKITYWRNDRNFFMDRALFQYGLGLCFFFLESERRSYYEYPYLGPNYFLVNPHYQNSSSRDLYFIPGLSFGLREKIYLGKKSADKPMAAVSFAMEYLFLKPVSKNPVLIQKLPVSNFNHLSMALGLSVPF